MIEVERIVADTEFDVHQLAKTHHVRRCYIKFSDGVDTADMMAVPLANLGIIAATVGGILVVVYRLDEWSRSALMIGWLTQADARRLHRAVMESERF